MKNLLVDVGRQLGFSEKGTIEAHLYKLLVYEKGGFFKTHRDNEKKKGMVGSLIIIFSFLLSIKVEL